MPGNETITGAIIGIRDCGTVVLVFVGNEEGGVAPVQFDHRSFRSLLDGGGCGSVDLIGRSVSLDGGTMTICD